MTQITGILHLNQSTTMKKCQ